MYCIMYEKVLAECGGVALLVYFGVGTSLLPGTSDLQTALTFGMAMYILVMSLRISSGGHLNPAVTLALALTKNIECSQAILFILGQIVGSLVGAALLLLTVPEIYYAEKCFGANHIRPEFGYMHAFVGELLGTFLVLYIVFHTSIHKTYQVGPSSALCIGMSVFVVHCLMIPINGCSINPARSFGPAVIASIRELQCEQWPQFFVISCLPSLGASLLAAACWKCVWEIQEKHTDLVDQVELKFPQSEHPGGIYTVLSPKSVHL
jgi:MIP family channel proteins